MTRRIPALLILAILMSPAPALADATTDQLVATRQAAMKADGRTLRGADQLSGDKAIAALQTVLDNYSKLPTLFPKDSLNDKSIAKPVIWQRFDDFSALFKKGADAAADGIAAAKAGDSDKYLADLQVIDKTCNDCHATFRSGP